jgi:thiamine-phosphate pyrophosphorylase
MLPSLYPILDASVLPELARQDFLRDLASQLSDAGVTLLQYRNKQGSDREMLSDASVIREAMQGCTLIFNDRADLALLSGFDGVHVGQGDLSPQGARRVVGASRIVGVSTHNEAQLLAADATDTDYIAIGPVFATSSKHNPDPVVGLQGVRLARKLTRKPTVAIGGINFENCESVRRAGADSVALISAIFSAESLQSKDHLRRVIKEFQIRLA